jgi:hypothetical protein
VLGTWNFFHMRHKVINLLTILIICPILVIQSFAGDKNKYDPTTLVFPAFLHTYGIRKATRFHLFMFTQNKIKFKNPQGLAVVRLAAWEDSTTNNDDDEVTVYGVNSGQNCIIYNKSMTSLGIYGLEKKGNQKLSQPRGIAANEQGEVYVADTGNNRIVRFFNPGHKLIFKRSLGGEASSTEQFNQPHDVALDSQGKLYIADSGNNRVQIYSSDLQFKKKFGNEAGTAEVLNFPSAIQVTDKKQRWSFYKEDFIIVIDNRGKRVQQFDLSGKFIRGIISSDFGFPESSLAYIAIDYYNNIYITDTKNHCIHKFDHRLKYLTSYGRQGKGRKEFLEPRGITINRHLGQVFVAEKWGAQYYWVGTDCFNFEVRTSQNNENIFFEYFLTEPSFITTDILDKGKKLVTRLWTKRFKKTGRQVDAWSGRIYAFADSLKEKYKISTISSNLKNVPPGNYIVKYKVEPTYSSYHYFEKIMEKALIVE